MQFHAYLWHTLFLMIIDMLIHAGVPINTGSVGTMFLFAALVEAFAAFSYFVLEKGMDRLYVWLLPKKKRRRAAELSPMYTPPEKTIRTVFDNPC